MTNETVVPCICNNPKCQTVFTARHFGSSTVNLVNIGSGPCPQCHSWGTIPDGHYSPTSRILFTKSQTAELLRSLENAKMKVQQSSSVAEMREILREEFPDITHPSIIKPRNAGEIIAFLNLLFLILTVFLKDDKQTTLHLNQESLKTIQEMTSDRAETPNTKNSQPQHKNSLDQTQAKIKEDITEEE